MTMEADEGADRTYGAASAEAQISIYGLDIARSSLARVNAASRGLLEPLRASLTDAEDALELERLRTVAKLGPSVSEATRCSRALSHITRAVEASRRFDHSVAKGTASAPKARRSAGWRTDPAAQLTAAAMDVAAAAAVTKEEKAARRRKRKRPRAKPLPKPRAERALRSQSFGKSSITSARVLAMETTAVEGEAVARRWEEERSLRSEDFAVFDFLARRFGPLESSLFAQSPMPGAAYRCLAYSSATRLQRWWLSSIYKLTLLRERAAATLQRVHRSHVARRRAGALRRERERQERLVRGALGRFFHRVLAICWDAWAQYTATQQEVKRRVRRILAGVKQRRFEDWRDWTEREREERRHRMIRAMARMLNYRLATTLSGWRALTVRNIKVRLFAEKLMTGTLSGSFAAWRECVKECRGSRVRLEAATDVQFAVRNYLGRRRLAEGRHEIARKRAAAVQLQRLARGSATRRELRERRRLLRLRREKAAARQRRREEVRGGASPAERGHTLAQAVLYGESTS